MKRAVERISYRTCKGKCEKKVLRTLLNPDGSCFECGVAIPEGPLANNNNLKHGDKKHKGDMCDGSWMGTGICRF